MKTLVWKDRVLVKMACVRIEPRKVEVSDALPQLGAVARHSVVFVPQRPEWRWWTVVCMAVVVVVVFCVVCLQPVKALPPSRKEMFFDTPPFVVHCVFPAWRCDVESRLRASSISTACSLCFVLCCLCLD